MTGENKDEWSHWLQIRPLESTARALSIAIYYIHEYDLWGVWRRLEGRWWAPTCSTQPLRHSLPGDQIGLLAPLCSPLLSPAQVPYRRRLTHFPSLTVILPGENRVWWCVCVYVSVLGERVGLQGWTKAPLLHVLYRDQGVTRAPEKARHFLSDTSACEVVSLMVCRGPVLCFAHLLAVDVSCAQIQRINRRALIGAAALISNQLDMKQICQQTRNLPNRAGPSGGGDAAYNLLPPPLYGR